MTSQNFEQTKRVLGLLFPTGVSLSPEYITNGIFSMSHLEFCKYCSVQDLDELFSLYSLKLVRKISTSVMSEFRRVSTCSFVFTPTKIEIDDWLEDKIVISCLCEEKLDLEAFYIDKLYIQFFNISYLKGNGNYASNHFFADSGCILGIKPGM